MWQFARSIDGMAAACAVFGTPVISGNVSFYNDTLGESIPPTPVVAMVGLIADASRVASSGFKRAGDVVYLLGEGEPELEGSEYLDLRHGQTGDRPPRIDLDAEKRLADLTVDLVGTGLVDTAHDVSDGGLAVALAEMCMASPRGLGGRVSAGAVERVDVALFGESGCRMLVAVDQKRADRLEQLAARARIPAARIGTTGGNRLVVERAGDAGRPALIDVEVAALLAASERTLPRIAEGVLTGRTC
jgi:phosphoribosylformylglycinamidine synthase